MAKVIFETIRRFYCQGKIATGFANFIVMFSVEKS
jgi:hypothetical protein